MIVCFESSVGNCEYQVNITVTNCDEYFVYMLPDTPTCMLRYCITN
jgi:hypothetical protein